MSDNNNTPTPGAWPDPAAALDPSLDSAGVIAATGCSPEDLGELSAIFRQETGNMLQRLEVAEQALLASEPGSPEWPQATEKLRTAAHELTTSFGIVGARGAETYSRTTQLRLRKSLTASPSATASAAPVTGTPAEAPPTADELRTAAAALQAAVRRVAQLLGEGR